MVQYILGTNYLEYRVVVILHLAIFITGLVTAILGWTLQREAAFTSGISRRYAVIPTGLALFVFSRYLPLFAGATTEEPLPESLPRTPGCTGPLSSWTWALWSPLRSRRPLLPGAVVRMPGRALYSLLGWFVLVPISVAAMAIVMLVKDDPNESLPAAVFLSLSAIVFTAFALWVHTRLTTAAQ